MIKSFSKIRPFKGELSFKGDKSVSHRALIFSAMAEGESIIYNLSDSADVNSTISCLQELGVEIIKERNYHKISGAGFRGFRKPGKQLDAGNSGTTARLMTGLLSVQDFESVITGDESLSMRPMDRVIHPLSLMGAGITSGNGRLPLSIFPSGTLKNISYVMIVPSAQVKSAIILAGLHLNEVSTILETLPTRNHTEMMLGLPIEKTASGLLIKVSREHYPRPKEFHIPGDISSASFFIVLTLLIPGARLLIKDILINESRTAFIKILQEMGADISIIPKGGSGGEPCGDINVEGSNLKNVKIPGDVIAEIIDEIPALTIAGIFASGAFVLRNASELRVKETDRIRALVDNLDLAGLLVKEYPDGFSVEGKITKEMPVFDSFGDHRIAMAFIILSCLLEKGGSIIGPECISISNPEFLEQLKVLESSAF